METPKILCPCACHRGAYIKHIMACCNNGFVEIPALEPDAQHQREPLTPLADKMLEAIFIKTGGRPENPQIARLCAAISEEHFKTIKIENNE